MTTNIQICQGKGCKCTCIPQCTCSICVLYTTKFKAVLISFLKMSIFQKIKNKKNTQHCPTNKRSKLHATGRILFSIQKGCHFGSLLVTLCFNVSTYVCNPLGPYNSIMSFPSPARIMILDPHCQTDNLKIIHYFLKTHLKSCFHP